MAISSGLSEDFKEYDKEMYDLLSPMEKMHYHLDEQDLTEDQLNAALDSSDSPPVEYVDPRKALTDRSRYVDDERMDFFDTDQFVDYYVQTDHLYDEHFDPDENNF